MKLNNTLFFQVKNIFSKKLVNINLIQIGETTIAYDEKNVMEIK